MTDVDRCRDHVVADVRRTRGDVVVDVMSSAQSDVVSATGTEKHGDSAKAKRARARSGSHRSTMRWKCNPET